MRRLLPLGLVLFGCASSNPVATKIDLALPPGAAVAGSSETDQGNQLRYEVDFKTRETAKALSDFYKSKGLDAVLQGDALSAVGTSPKGQLLKVDFKGGQGRVVAIQTKAP
jgi:hypothetical protein